MAKLPSKRALEHAIDVLNCEGGWCGPGPERKRLHAVANYLERLLKQKPSRLDQWSGEVGLTDPTPRF